MESKNVSAKIICIHNILISRYWWCDNSIGLKYTDVGSAVDAQEYYDNMAEDYEKVVRAWGYNMPEVWCS